MLIWTLLFILISLVGVSLALFIHLKMRLTMYRDMLIWLKKLHHDTLALQEKLKEALKHHPTTV